MADAKKVELVARAMCTARGFAPDGRSAWGRPLTVEGGYLMPGTTVETWQLFARNATIAVEAIEAGE